MSNVESYLSTLREQGGERRRVTRQLQELVANTLAVIAREAELGATYQVPGSRIVLKVEEIQSSLSTWRTVTFTYEGKESFWNSSRYRVFSAKCVPWATFFYDKDMDLKIGNAGRPDWLTLANALPAVAAGFVVDTVKVKEAILATIRELRTWAEDPI